MDASYRRITHNTSFRPKDDETRLNGYGRSRRNSFLPVTIETKLGYTSLRSGVGAMVLMIEAIIHGRLFIVPRSTRILDQWTKPRYDPTLKLMFPYLSSLLYLTGLTIIYFP